MQDIPQPLVSVVIPFLNSGKFLKDTIKSVVNQTYSNWEIILVDDGSSDDSIDIIKSFTLQYPDRIFCFHHPNHENRGAAASRNLGIAKASGELLTFLDSDDLWLPDKLMVQVNFMQAHPEVSVLCEATKYWYSWYDPKLEDYIITIGAPVNKIYQPPQLAVLLYPLGNGDSFCTCAMMMRTHRIRAIGGFNETFTGSNQLFEDQVLFLKICLHETVYLSSTCNNIYRQRPNSLMHGIVSEGHYGKAKLFFLNWLKDYLQEKKIANKEVYVALRKAFLPFNHPTLYKLNTIKKKVVSKVKRQLKTLFQIG